MYKEMFALHMDVLGLLDEIDHREGVLDPELEKRWDDTMRAVAEKADEFADIIAYLTNIVKQHREKVLIHSSKARSTENHITLLKSMALKMIKDGVDFEGDAKKVIYSERIIPKLKKDKMLLNIDRVPEKYIKTKHDIDIRQYLKDIASGEERAPEGFYFDDTVESISIR